MVPTAPEKLPEIVILDQERMSLWLTLKLSGAAPTEVEVRVLSSATWVPEVLVRAEQESSSPTIVVLGCCAGDSDPLQLLRRMKTDAVLRHYPAIFLIPPEREDLVPGAYEALANAVILQPGTLDGCAQLLKELAAYWFDVVTPSPRFPSP